MGYIRAVKTGLRIAGRIDQKYNVNKIFVNKYVPPGYRKLTNRIFDIAGTLAGGYGLYGFINSLIAPDSPGNSAPIPFQKQFPQTYKSYQTRSRRSGRTSYSCKYRYNSYPRRGQSYSSRYN